MQAQNKIQNKQGAPILNKQGIQVPKDTIAMMEQEKRKKINENKETENSPKLDAEYHKELSKELEVPKDQMQMIQEKEDSKKIQPQIIRINDFIKQRNQAKEQGQNKMQNQKSEDKKVDDVRLSGKIEQKLSPIKQEKPAQQSKDLLNFDVQPIRIQPQLKTRESQEQLMKEMYQPKQDRQIQLERKQQLTPKQADKIMKQLKEDEMKDEKQQDLENKADVRKKQREQQQEDSEIKQRDLKKQNERKSKKIVKQPKQDKKVTRLGSKNIDKAEGQEPKKLNKQNQIKAG